MAKKDFGWNLIEYKLSDEELEAFDEWSLKQPPTFAEQLNELGAMDYKISFTFVSDEASWCVSITGKKDAKVNADSTLTNWGDDAIECLAIAYFKVMKIFERGVWKTRKQSRRG